MVSLPDPSPVQTLGGRGNGADRRDRRARVEDLLIDGHAHLKICAMIFEQFGVSSRTTKSDIARVLRGWAKEDTTRSWQRRTRVIRRLERIAARAESLGDLAQARMATRDIGRLLGMGNRLEVEVGVRGKVVHEHRIADPATWVPAFLECAAEVGMLPGVLPLMSGSSPSADSAPAPHGAPPR